VPPRVPYDVESLTDVALGVFRQRGYDATSMEHGISKAAFYHHIGGKEELLSRGLDRALDALTAVLDEPAATTGPAIDRLRHVLTRTIELVHELLPEVTVLLRTRGNSPAERAALERRRAFDSRVALLVAAAQSDGSVRTDIEPILVARLAIGMVNSITEWYRPSGPIGPHNLCTQIVSLILTGIESGS
jgi:AcrR family transcriptional regulator